MKEKETIADELIESVKNGVINLQQITDLIDLYTHLEQQLAEKDKEIEKARLDGFNEGCSVYQGEYKNIIDKLYDEIEKWENGVYISQATAKQSFKLRDKFEKQIRHQVCEEIKNKIKCAKLIYEWKGAVISIEQILAEVEKGE